MKCGLTIWLFALPAYGLKIGEGLVFNQSAEGFPTCTGAWAVFVSPDLLSKFRVG